MVSETWDSLMGEEVKVGVRGALRAPACALTGRRDALLEKEVRSPKEFPIAVGSEHATPPTPTGDLGFLRALPLAFHSQPRKCLCQLSDGPGTSRAAAETQETKILWPNFSHILNVHCSALCQL